MSVQEQANLILKLYDLRREETMRKARDWFFMQFHPQSIDEFYANMMGPNSAMMRMVPSYWEMAATLVIHGAIDVSFFNEANGEHFGVFAKLEPFLPELRKGMVGERFLQNLEKLIDATEGGRQRCAEIREMMKSLRDRAQAAASK